MNKLWREANVSGNLCQVSMTPALGGKTLFCPLGVASWAAFGTPPLPGRHQQRHKRGDLPDTPLLL